jgi:PST family polysaccharide transporter
MGSVAAVSLILGMIRTKFAAILIGTTGVGISSNFTSIQAVVGAIAGLGIQYSAVREIAVADAANNEEAVGRIMLSLRRVCWLTGCFGMLTMGLMSSSLSQWTFGSDEYRLDIAALGIVILLSNIQGGQTALIQGKRRTADLAKAQLFSALIGTLVTIVFYFWMGIRGIIPALVLMSSFQLFISWCISKKIELLAVKMSWKESFFESRELLRLGIVMMWTGLLGGVVGYVTNALITHHIGIEGVGINSAAFALSGVFIGFVLNSMGADYYPRLSGAASDRVAINRLVNEQTEIGLLLAAPGLMATIAIAPFAVGLFYSQDFLPAANLLKWFVFGCFGRVISWPLGFVMLALNKKKLFFIVETTTQLVYVALIYFGIKFFGLEGVSIAFCILYLIYGIVVSFITEKLTNFRWSRSSKCLFIIYLNLLLITFFAERLLAPIPGLFISLLVTLFGVIVSIRGVLNRVDQEHRIVKILLRIPGMNSLSRIRVSWF